MVRGGLMSWFVVVRSGSWWFRGGSWWFNVRGGSCHGSWWFVVV